MEQNRTTQEGTNLTTDDRPVDGIPVDHIPTDGIPTDGIDAAYDARGLDRLSDAALVAAVVAVVAEPREGPADSFVLHAPLELTARARLLARTPAPHRRMARLRLVSIAARYQEHAAAELPAITHHAGTTPSTATRAMVDTALAEVLGAIDAGDLPAVDAAVQHLASLEPDPSSIIAPLAAAIAPRTAAAAHGPIFLATLAEAPAETSRWLALLRPLARELARRPDWGLTWIDRVTEGASCGNGSEPRSVDAGALFEALAEPPWLGVPGSSFIHPLLMQVDAPGVADVVLGPIVGPRVGLDTSVAGNTDAARAITRVAALAMIRDDPDHAPYGWTHCLTLPHAVLVLADGIDRFGGHALAVAATQVLGIRAGEGTRALDPDDELIRPADPATIGARSESLIIEAARRHDAHVAKYILTSLTAAANDPDAGHLHLSAAEHLLAAWDQQGPDPDDLLGVMG